MTTILIKTKSKKEKDFLKYLFDKMHIDAQIVGESVPNYRTRKAMDEVEMKKGSRVNDSTELFDKLGI